jgi:hypothetical protein
VCVCVCLCVCVCVCVSPLGRCCDERPVKGRCNYSPLTPSETVGVGGGGGRQAGNRQQAAPSQAKGARRMKYEHSVFMIN